MNFLFVNSGVFFIEKVYILMLIWLFSWKFVDKIIFGRYNQTRIYG